MKYRIFLLVSILFFFSSCKKTGNGNCPDPTDITITTNSPVVLGWPIYVSSTATMSYMYHWTGPNGWDINYNFYASDAYSQQRLNATYADSGLYKLELRNSDGCVVERGTTTIKVIAAPAPPCSITNNSSTSNIIGVGGVTYTNIYFTPSTFYAVQGTGGGQSITMYFQGNVPPKPGVYKTSGYAPTKDTEVGCWITASPYDFINQAGQDVYVNLVGGKTQISFCNCNFTNPLGSTIPKISAKITQP
jgi:hypothetical protein